MASAQLTYDRIAPVYDVLDGAYERMWKRRLRAEVFRGLSGDILDAGAGTGCNFVAYPRGARMTAIDASAPMLARARIRAERLDLDVELAAMDMTKLDLRDASFDAVVATFVFMCIPGPQQARCLAEVARVCRPGGQIRIVDYRMSQKPLVRIAMRAMSPWLRMTFAATYEPSTAQHFAAAGLRLIEERPLFGDVVTMSILTPERV